MLEYQAGYLPTLLSNMNGTTVSRGSRPCALSCHLDGQRTHFRTLFLSVAQRPLKH